MRKTQYLLTASSDSKGPVERNTLKCDAYNREYIKYKFLSLARISSKMKSFFFMYTFIYCFAASYEKRRCRMQT